MSKFKYNLLMAEDTPSRPENTKSPERHLGKPVVIDAEKLVRNLGSAIRPDVFPGNGSSVGVLNIESTGNKGLILQSMYGCFDSQGKWMQGVKTTTAGFYYDDEGIVRKLYLGNENALSMTIADLTKVDPALTEFLTKIRDDMQAFATDEPGYYSIPRDVELRVKPFDDQKDAVIAYESSKKTRALHDLKESDLLNLPLSSKEPYHGPNTNVATVIQGEVAYVVRGRGKQVANTYGYSDCVAYIAGDKEAGVFAVAHIDGATDLDASIPALIGELRNRGGKNIEAHLFGGLDSSASMVLELVKRTEHEGIKIVEADILNGTRSRSIGVSTDGVFYNNKFSDLDPSEGDRLDGASSRGTYKQQLSTYYHPDQIRQ